MAVITGPLSVSPDPGNPYIGRGVLYLDRWDASGNRTGERHVGNVTTFEVEDKPEIKELYESMDPASSLYSRAVTRQTVGISITGDEYTLDNLALALNGTLETVTGAGATVSDESITGPNGATPGRYYALAHRNITTLTDIKIANTTSLVLGTDYTADLVNGRIYILPSSTTVTPGSLLTADYVYGQYTYNAVAIATVALIDCYLRFIGNPIKGRTFQHEFWHVSFAPSGKLGFISDDFGNWQLDGMVIADSVNHPNEPLGHIIQIA